MKKILIMIMSLFLFTHISFAESIMPVTKTDVDLMVTELRNSFCSGILWWIYAIWAFR